MPTLWHTILDTILPPTEAGKIIRELNTTTVSNFYRPRYINQHLALTSYKNNYVQALITDNKFHANPQAAQYLGQLLSQHLCTYTTPLTLVPIPLSRARYQRRMYNQVSLILDRLDTSKISVPVRTVSYLSRTRDTVPQTQLERRDRLENMKGAFAAKKSLTDLEKDEQIIIIDDVLTTGATLTAAKKSLKSSVPKDTVIRTLAIAH